MRKFVKITDLPVSNKQAVNQAKVAVQKLINGSRVDAKAHEDACALLTYALEALCPPEAEPIEPTVLPEGLKTGYAAKPEVTTAATSNDPLINLGVTADE